MLNIIWLHVPKCKHLLLPSVLHDCKLNIFGFWTSEDIAHRALAVGNVKFKTGFPCYSNNISAETISC